MMAAGRRGASHEYVDIFLRTFGIPINNRNYFFIYVKEAVSSGSTVHLSFTSPNMPNSVTWMHVSQSNADTDAARVATVNAPVDNIDITFTTTMNVPNYFGVFFSEALSGVQITDIVLEKEV